MDCIQVDCLPQAASSNTRLVIGEPAGYRSKSDVKSPWRVLWRAVPVAGAWAFASAVAVSYKQLQLHVSVRRGTRVCFETSFCRRTDHMPSSVVDDAAEDDDDLPLPPRPPPGSSVRTPASSQQHPLTPLNDGPTGGSSHREHARRSAKQLWEPKTRPTSKCVLLAR